MQRIPGVTTTDVQGNDFVHGPALSRLRGLAAAGHAAGARRLHARHPRQRSLRRHRQLGLDPDDRDRPRGHLDQQSSLRPQRPRRRDQPPDEGRLHLQRHRIRCVRRLLRPRRRLPAIRRAQRGMGALSRGGRPQGRRLALPVAIAARRASTAISAGGAQTPRSTSSRPSPTTISAWSGRRRSNCSTNDYRAIYTWPQTTKNDRRSSSR